MQLLGGKIDWMVYWWYLFTGQGLSAYEGGAGGYSEGHFFGRRSLRTQLEELATLWRNAYRCWRGRTFS